MLLTAGPAELIRMNATGQESWRRVLEPSALPARHKPCLLDLREHPGGLRKGPWGVGAFGKLWVMAI